MKDVIPLEKYSQLLALQEKVNLELKELYEENEHLGREYLSSLLVNEIKKLVNRLNSNGWSFGRCSYGGDVNFENSEQTYSDGQEMGQGTILNFRGFSCQVSWEGADKYSKV